MSRFAFPALFASMVFASSAPAQESFERGEPRIYRGEHQAGVGMPVGGIGTGCVWIAGEGGLPVWQMFNNLNEQALVPESFLALRLRAAGKEPLLCALDPTERSGFRSLKALSFRGDYPFAWLDYSHPDLPVEISLEVFNPLIPLNLDDSSLPCAIFRLSVTNRGDKPVEAAPAFMLLNAVGYDGQGKIEGRRFPGFGGNQNRLVKIEGGAAFLMDVPERNGSVLETPLKIAHAGPWSRPLSATAGLTVNQIPDRGPLPAGELFWFEGGGEQRNLQILAALDRVGTAGGAALLVDPPEELIALLAEIAAAPGDAYEVLADFEGQDYQGWVARGTAFGTQPARGSLPRQQPVSGFLGRGLVNSFLSGDASTGTLVSPPFTIRRSYLGFLIGGGRHPGRTCLNLKVGGKVVRTATGRNDEALAPHWWDLSDLKGKRAVLEIVDQETGAWGHINVDQIVAADRPPAPFLVAGEELAGLLRKLPAFEPSSWRESLARAGWDEVPPDAPSGLLSGVFGAGRLLLAERCEPLAALRLLAEARGVGFRPGTGLPPDSPLFGSLALAALGGEASACAEWKGGFEQALAFATQGRLTGPEEAGPSLPGESLGAALALPFTLAQGETRTVTFVLAWSFPNLERFGHKGNLYAERFPHAKDALDHVCTHLEALTAATRLYRDTLYETDLPFWLLDCLSSQSCIPRTVLCFYAARHASTGEPYFAGYEGCYGCCPLNCTHVWNYAQTHARLFPEIGRNLRRFDFNHYLLPDGEHQHRQHRPSKAFIDGQCAIIAGAYREHLLSPDESFLGEIWPGVRSSIEWLIKAIDQDEDGVNAGQQWNTYDVATSGAHTFLGSQYLCALAAGERMALVMGDETSASRWAKIRQAGSENQDSLLWGGEYYIQIPDAKPARDYNGGCHSDQLLGQWWAHMLDLGRLYPKGRTVRALSSIFRYNFRADFRGFRQAPRRYVLDDESGLLLCTWPKNDRPDPFILYADEVWTGIEYSTAGLMLYEGLLEEALLIVKAARDRYDGRPRGGLNSGPGGNPFCELECGRFYARALSSWSLLLAAQGFIHDGPAGRIGFLPRWRPERHTSFFVASEGWGLFTQEITGPLQEARLKLEYGRLAVRELCLARRPEESLPRVELVVAGRPLEAEPPVLLPDRVLIPLPGRFEIRTGETLTIRLHW